MGELSYRGGITESGGKLSADWRELFARHSDRFVLGSDTWINERWVGYDTIMQTYRDWLAQLPDDQAKRIAHGNAERLFGAKLEYLPEVGERFGLFKDDAGIVVGECPGGFALIQHPGVRPVGYARAALTAFLVAHDVAPFAAVDVTVAIGKGRLIAIDQAVMSRAQDVADFVRDRDGDGGAGVVDDKEGLLRLGADAGGEAAAGVIIDDQADDIGAFLVAQAPDVLERHLTVDQVVEMFEVFAAGFVVIDQLSVDQAQADVANAAVAKSLVGLLDGKLQEICRIANVAACGLAGIKQHQIDGNLLGL